MQHWFSDGSGRYSIVLAGWPEELGMQRGMFFFDAGQLPSEANWAFKKTSTTSLTGSLDLQAWVLHSHQQRMSMLGISDQCEAGISQGLWKHKLSVLLCECMSACSHASRSHTHMS